MARCSPSGMRGVTGSSSTLGHRFFSFSSGRHSRTTLHSSWLHGSLSRALLADVRSSGSVSACHGSLVPDGTMETAACSVVSEGLALNSSSLLQSCPCSFHWAPGRAQTPLVRLRPRGQTPYGTSRVDGRHLVPGAGAGVFTNSL